MIGLEYILLINNVSYSELSKELGVTRANFYNWINRSRNIPEKYIIILSSKFNMPKEYFQEILNDDLKIKILLDEILNIKSKKLNSHQ
ncbi:hypothetical protein [Clostridium sp.]|uniref:hypothetical protein n=1 Tax=Clostridium sp. TaxID=1506 RepID=UPI00263A1428|nr:hypothetical protein [Clostridium sp.]